jgi:hypothetical protein
MGTAMFDFSGGSLRSHLRHFGARQCYFLIAAVSNEKGRSVAHGAISMAER